MCNNINSDIKCNDITNVTHKFVAINTYCCNKYICLDCFIN